MTGTATQSEPRACYGCAAATPWVAFCLLWLATLLLIVPRFEAVFRDFGVALPLLTRWLIGASSHARFASFGSASVGVMLWLVITGGLAAALLVGILPSKARTMLAVVGWILCLAALLVIATALVIPLLAVMQSAA